MSAINIAISAFMEKGSHALVTEGAYEPTAELSLGTYQRFGVEFDFISPMIGEEIVELIQPNTKVVYLESSSSNTFEIFDLENCHQCNQKRSSEIGQEIAILFDNTWAGPIYFRTFEHDIDVEIQAATKYVVGHSDAMLGIVACNEKTFLKGQKFCKESRHLCRTRCLLFRLKRTQNNGCENGSTISERNEHSLLARFHPMVQTVLFPPLPSSEYFQNWKNYFTGGGSLMSIVLNQKYQDQNLEKFFDDMQIFYGI